MDDQEPPPRRAICLECRTLCLSDSHCMQSRRHHVVSLETEHGRDALYREIWETPWVPGNAMPRIKRLAATAVLAPGIVGLVWVSAWATAGTALIAGSALARSVIQARRQRTVALGPPRGRPGHMRLLGRRETRHRGLLRSTQLTAPLTGRPCLGYSVIVRASEFFGGDVMLIDAWIGAGSIELDDGRTLQISRGVVELDAPAPVEITEQAAIERYLAGLAPGLARGASRGAMPGATPGATPGARNDGAGAPAAGPRRFFPYDLATESIIPLDAEVEVVGKTVEVPGLYRDGGRSYRLREVPVVRVVQPPAPALAEP